MQKPTYNPLFLVGVSALLLIGVFAVCLIFQSDHQKSSHEKSVLHELNSTEIRSEVVADTRVSRQKVDNKYNDSKAEPVNVSVSNSAVEDSYCSEQCREDLELLRLQVGLNDDEYEKILGRSDELAAYLKQNPTLIKEILELARTADGDTRSVIMALFDQLDISARELLGHVLIESSDWRSRFDGINFLAQSDIMDKQLAQRFSDMLDVEENYYVRSSIVKAFNHPDKFYGSQEILSILEQLEYSDVDATVRGEALLVRVKLEQEPENVFYDVLSAIRSHEADYQGYGLRALEQIVTLKTRNQIELSWNNDYEAKLMFSELMNHEYYDMPLELRKIADGLQERLF